MPFKSQAQERFMYAEHPAIAKRWSQEYPNQPKLPQYVTPQQKVTSAILARKR